MDHVLQTVVMPLLAPALMMMGDMDIDMDIDNDTTVTTPTSTQKNVLFTNETPSRGLTLENVLEEAQVLEHFHVYRQPKKNTQDNNNKNRAALELHLDQGLLLAFSPAVLFTERMRIQGEEEKMEQQNNDGGFYIQLQDGSLELVDFLEHDDDIVLFLGEAANQILNPHLDAHHQVRPLVHSLIMPDTTVGDDDDEDDVVARVWYGRMMLPPPQALHPSSINQQQQEPLLEQGVTYGEIRQAMIDHQDATASSTNTPNIADILSLGCGSTFASASTSTPADDDGSSFPSLVARQLAGDCDPTTQAACWHQCMNLTDHGVSPEICSAATQEQEPLLTMSCANDDGYLWNGVAHDNQFKLKCVDLATAENFTYPDLDPCNTTNATAISRIGGGGRGRRRRLNKDEHSEHSECPEHHEAPTKAPSDDSAAAGGGLTNSNAFFGGTVLIVLTTMMACLF